MFSDRTLSRTTHAAFALAWFAVCVVIVWFTTGLIRGAAGDIAIIPLLVHLVGVAVPGFVGARVGAVLLLAVGLEFGQLLHQVGPEDPMWKHLIFGSTFDPVDIGLYVVGAAVSLAVHKALTEQPSPS